MSTGISVRSLSAISLATTSMVLLGRQKTTSSRITVDTDGLAASGARRSGSRVWMSVTTRASIPALRSPSNWWFWASLRGVGAGGLLFGEAAQDVLPGLGLGRLGGGAGAGGGAQDARLGRLELALARLRRGALGG